MTSSTEPTVHEESGADWTDWTTIAIGDLVELKDRRVWQCIDRHGDVVKVERDDGKVYEGTPTGRVKVVDTAQRSLERAVALTQVHLGGEHIATRDAEGRYLVPATFPDPGSLMSHIYVMHGVVVQAPRGLHEEQGLRETLKKHEWLHRPENKGKEYVNHYHDPEFYKERGVDLPAGLRGPAR